MNTKPPSEQSCVEDWSDSEFKNIDLGDSRLEKRVIRVASDLLGSPTAPINHASLDRASMKAAYRLFDNEKVTTEGILKPHRQNTIERLQGEEVVLLHQDTCFIDYTKHPSKKDLGPLSTSKTRGICLHSSLATTTSGLPVGILHQRYWVRKEKDKPGDLSKGRNFEDKESFKWVETMREVGKLDIAAVVVHVGDCENDIYQFMREAQQDGHKFLVRCQYNRSVENEYGEQGKVKDLVKTTGEEYHLSVDIPSRKSSVTLACRYGAFTIPGTTTQGVVDQVPVKVWTIHLEEINPEEGVEPISWTLSTNVPVCCLEDALERIKWYRLRWRIEEYHKILKSGCSIEACRLRTFDKLVRFIALKSVIAWRLFWCTHLNRVAPNSPASEVLTVEEIRTLRRIKRFQGTVITRRKNLTVRQVVKAIAQLGGYRGTKKEFPPAIWSCGEG